MLNLFIKRNTALNHIHSLNCTDILNSILRLVVDDNLEIKVVFCLKNIKRHDYRIKECNLKK